MKINKLFDLQGKSALITGGSRGLGLQIAHALGEAGAALILTARKQDELDAAQKELAAAGHEVRTIRGDISDRTQIGELVDSALVGTDGIDILINNAGTTWGSPSLDYPAEAWDKVIALNLTSVFLLTREVVKRSMMPRGGGKIVNLASTAGLVGVMPEVMSTIAYHSSKGGLINMTRALAAEWARNGITVNAIAPGFFPTKISEKTLAEKGDEYLRTVPMHRFGRDHDLKGVAVLLSSAASDYITGQTIVVDGGYTSV